MEQAISVGGFVLEWAASIAPLAALILLFWSWQRVRSRAALLIMAGLAVWLVAMWVPYAGVMVSRWQPAPRPTMEGGNPEAQQQTTPISPMRIAKELGGVLGAVLVAVGGVRMSTEPTGDPRHKRGPRRQRGGKPKG